MILHVVSEGGDAGSPLPRGSPPYKMEEGVSTL